MFLKSALPSALAVTFVLTVADASRAQGEGTASTSPPAAASQVVIPEGMIVKVQLGQKVKARKVRAGETVEGSTSEDVVVQGVRVIAAGAPVTLVVTEARRRKAGYFRTAEGYLAMDAVSVKAVDGTDVPIKLVVPIEAGNQEKKFTWTAHAANVKAETTFVAKVQAGTKVTAR